jgi:hypothetical protein
LATLDSIVTGIGSVSTWFWSLFQDFLDMIVSNSLLLWAVAFAIVAGSVGLLIKVVRRFGVKGHR